MLKFDIRDESEQVYTAKFMQMAGKHGIAIHYATDRAALDLGLHLTVPVDRKKKGVTAKRVWFQFKGIDAGQNGISKEKFNNITDISLSGVSIEHLRQWYRYSEPVYLTVYLESIEKFFAVDVHKLVNERWGASIFDDKTFIDGNGKLPKTTTVHLPKTSEVDEAFWNSLSKHRSMRIDGEAYQGRPLVDSSDFQSKVPKIMDSKLFEDIIGQLLTVHKYNLVATTKNVSSIYPSADEAGDIVSISYGKLFEPLQYDLYLTRELLPDEDGYREDGQTFKVQGNCAVIIHSLVKTQPDTTVKVPFF